MKIVVAGIVVYFCLFLGANEGSASLLDADCGTTHRPSRVRRIVGGQDAERFANPWMVMVLDGIRFICGGSLITSRTYFNYIHIFIYFINTNYKSVECFAGFVLTTAYCISASPTEHTNEINIDRKIAHSQFEGRNSKYDIGLLRMAQQVSYSDYIRPICLLVNEEVKRTSPLFKLTGWGETENGKMIKILKTTNLENLHISHCILEFGWMIDESHICAGSYTSDSCYGDSGSPLSAELSYAGINRVFQFGIVSLGSASCRSFGVYTNVTHYLGWVEDEILRNSDYRI
ncbi:hypothetical protein KR084_001164 [Drosophila pseudotakahashii]|nr:hypothetical protein KR084_001164 [Drosophila pseudotakahashii]